MKPWFAALMKIADAVPAHDPYDLNAALAARKAARPARQEAAQRGAVTRRERVA